MKIKFIKNIYLILISIFFIGTFNLYANNISNIEEIVTIKDDGSALVVSKWVGTFTSGTENYIPINTSDISIKDFKVQMNDKTFTSLDTWRVQADFSDKAYKSGIYKTDDGVELCFGISEYGNNTYNITYTIVDLVKSYREKDGFNFQFFNPHMNTYPTNIRLVIRLENGINLNKTNAKIYGFGYKGDITFNEGNVYAYTNSPLYSSNYMTIALGIDKDIIKPIKKVDKSFDEIINKAFTGSDYTKDSVGDYFELILFATIVILILIIFTLYVINRIIRKSKLKKFYKNVEYFRDVPNDGNICLTYVFMNDFYPYSFKKENIIAALMLKMINEKNIISLEDKTYGFFGKEKKKISFEFKKEPENKILKDLYDLIYEASGNDKVLQEDELKKYLSNSSEILQSFLDEVRSEGRNAIRQKGYYKKLLSGNLDGLTYEGREQLSQVFGLKKFLDDFTLIDEREIKEVEIWEDLLIYATLFGIADKTLKELKKMYPEMAEIYTNYEMNIEISRMIGNYFYMSMMRQVARQVQFERVSGFGGRASFGGGGGFSGGGIGGGSR